MVTEPGSHSLGYTKPVVTHDFARLDEGSTASASAALAAEVPVALVYNGRPHAVMMCTPADLEDFGVGFTVTELVASAADISRLDVVKYARGIELQIEIPRAAADALASRGRAIVGRTGCGLCGVEVIDDALREPRAVTSPLAIPRSALWRASESLDALQPLNRDTNAIHAAAWASAEGTLRVVREDVGRHNALDKLIGGLRRKGIDLSRGMILLTSRVSVEMVQKAATAGAPIVVAVSAPTGFALKVAEAAGITLVAVARQDGFEIFTHPQRIRGTGDNKPQQKERAHHAA